MPPTVEAAIPSVVAQLWHANIMERQSSQPQAMEERPLGFSVYQVSIQQALALTAASISLLFGLVTFGWFLRMKQMFRHRLIMLLIMSDMLKALWYFIYPIILYGDFNLRQNRHLCQATGFFLVVGIEGADYAVLMIAIHAALGIFSKKASMGEGGLFHYRYFVYTGWVLTPILMASLAFINNSEAYVNQGTFCYLPVRPIWYRLALSWIPRYLILIAIVIISAVIYSYVRVTFKNFDVSTDDSYNMSSELSQKNRMSTGPPTDGNTAGSSIPTIAEGSIPGLSSKTFVEQSDSVAQKDFEGAPSWENYTFGGPTPIPKMQDHELNKEDLYSKLQEARHRSDGSLQSAGYTDDTAAIIEALKENEPPSTRLSVHDGMDGNMSKNNLALVDSRNQPIATARLRERHKAIQRQLRYVFVYPLVYFVLWIIPFVQHCRNYNTELSRHPSFPLNCLTTATLALQCAIDSIVFCTREKPWRHVSSRALGRPQSFIQSITPSFHRRSRGLSTASDGLSSRPEYKSSRHRAGLPFQPPHLRHGLGKSESDRIAEARQARHRRDVEESAAREGREEVQKRRKMSEVRRKGHGRSWWEVEGRRRKDSVLLGTDMDDDQPGKPKSPVGDSGGRSLPVGVDTVQIEDARNSTDDVAPDEQPVSEARREMSVVLEEDEPERTPRASRTPTALEIVNEAPETRAPDLRDGSEGSLDVRSERPSNAVPEGQ